MYNLSETIACFFFFFVFFFFFFLVLTNPQDRVQLNNIFEKIMKEKTYLENYSILTKVRENFDRHEEFI